MVATATARAVQPLQNADKPTLCSRPFHNLSTLHSSRWSAKPGCPAPWPPLSCHPAAVRGLCRFGLGLYRSLPRRLAPLSGGELCCTGGLSARWRVQVTAGPPSSPGRRTGSAGQHLKCPAGSRGLARCSRSARPEKPDLTVQSAVGSGEPPCAAAVRPRVPALTRLAPLPTLSLSLLPHRRLAPGTGTSAQSGW